MSLTLDEAIYNKYVLPTERPAGRHVGPEFEFPIVNLGKKPVDLDSAQEVVSAFADSFGFSERKADDDGRLYSLTDPVTGDNLSFDCSYNTLELSFGKEENINVLSDRFGRYFHFIQHGLRKSGQLITGLCANPYHRYNTYEPITNARYRMLKKFLDSYREYDGAVFHDIPQFSMIAAASQVQIDVNKDELIRTINTFNRIEPLKALLFANSAFDGLPELAISRDYFWKYSSQGYNKHNVDMFDADLSSVDEYIEYVKGQSIYCGEHEGKYVHFRPIPLREYVALPEVTGRYYEDGGWHELSFRPDVTDIEYHRTFKFVDLTFGGTIEYRSGCEQPISEVFSLSAFHAGLAEKTGDLYDIIYSDDVIYRHGYSPNELREIFTHRELPQFADRKALSALLYRILDLAASGLAERGLGEEHFLRPLYYRAEHLTNPALELLRGLELGDSIEEWIEKYSAL